jgi:hypothetical protein
VTYWLIGLTERDEEFVSAPNLLEDIYEGRFKSDSPKEVLVSGAQSATNGKFRHA